jgi:predicted nicotinamide N-methyase
VMAAGGEDDFLWDCAMRADHSLDFVAPNREDEYSQLVESDLSSYPTSFAITSTSELRPRSVCQNQCECECSPGGDKPITCTVCRHGLATASVVGQSQYYAVTVNEVRGQGILDNIGGVLWEASLLLSQYLLMVRQDIVYKRVLELGAGVGLPSLLLVEMKLLHGDHQPVHISDNDARVLRNLVHSINTNYPDALLGQDEGSDRYAIVEESSPLRVHVHHLDWADFAVDGTIGSSDHAPPIFDVDIIIGSALCYARYHTCLADTMLHFLTKGRCKEVIIIQIKDRPGFDRFLWRLEELGVSFRLDEVPQSVYDAAFDITRSAHCSTSEDTQAGEVIQSMEFYFPRPARVGDLPAAIGTNGDSSRVRQSIMHTSRETFVLLTATLK